jgi:hypothetical protein
VLDGPDVVLSERTLVSRLIWNKRENIYFKLRLRSINFFSNYLAKTMEEFARAKINKMEEIIVSDDEVSANYLISSDVVVSLPAVLLIGGFEKIY